MSTSDATGDDVGLETVEVWIEAARNGCSESLGKLAQRCHRYLLLVANKELDDDLKVKVGASDLVQETLLQAQKCFGRFVGQSDEELRAWLRQILINRIRSTIREFRGVEKREIGRETRLGAQDSGPKQWGHLVDKAATPGRQAMLNERAQTLEAALGKLSNDHRQVIVLRSVERRSFNEIGRVMGRSADAARKLWLRALKQLEQEWNESDGP